MQIYILVRAGYEYNDEYYYSNDSYDLGTGSYLSLPKAQAAADELNKLWRKSGDFEGWSEEDDAPTDPWQPLALPVMDPPTPETL